METVNLKHYCQLLIHMIGKGKINHIKRLSLKKYRQKNNQFLVEGDKNVVELLRSPFQALELYATIDFIAEHQEDIYSGLNVIPVESSDIKRASLLKNPQRSMAICAIPKEKEVPSSLSGLSFYLDNIQDPGNLGTILRICDWFGIEHLFCSPDTADVFSPKVIQSSMGSFLRTNCYYLSFKKLAQLTEASNIPILGTFMGGNTLHSTNLPHSALIILGNEGNGIRKTVAEKVTQRITIPSFYSGKTGAESLNVAVTAGILANEFR